MFFVTMLLSNNTSVLKEYKGSCGVCLVSSSDHVFKLLSFHGNRISSEFKITEMACLQIC